MAGKAKSVLKVEVLSNQSPPESRHVRLHASAQLDLHDKHLQYVNDALKKWKELMRKPGFRGKLDWKQIKERLEAEAKRSDFESIAQATQRLKDKIQAIERQLLVIARQARILSDVEPIKTLKTIGGDQTVKEMMQMFAKLAKRHPVIWSQIQLQGEYSKYGDDAFASMLNRVDALRGESTANMERWQTRLEEHNEAAIQWEEDRDRLQQELNAANEKIRDYETTTRSHDEDDIEKLQRLEDELEEEKCKVQRLQTAAEKAEKQHAAEVEKMDKKLEQALQKSAPRAEQYRPVRVVGPAQRSDDYSDIEVRRYKKDARDAKESEEKLHNWSGRQELSMPPKNPLAPTEREYFRDSLYALPSRDGQTTGIPVVDSHFDKVQAGIASIEQQLGVEREKREADKKRDAEERGRLQSEFDNELAKMRDAQSEIKVSDGHVVQFGAECAAKWGGSQIQIKTHAKHLEVDAELRNLLNKIQAPTDLMRAELRREVSMQEVKSGREATVKSIRMQYKNESTYRSIADLTLWLLQHVAKMDRKRSDLDAEIRALKARIEDDKENRQVAINAVREIELKAISNDREKSLAALKDAQSKISELNESLQEHRTSSEEQNIEATKQVTGLEGQIALQKNQIEVAGRALRHAQDTIKARDGEIKTLSETEAVNRSKITGLETELRLVREKGDAMQEQLDKLEVDKAEGDRKLEQMRTDLTTAQLQSAGAGDVDKLMGELRGSYSARIEDGKRRVDDLSAEIKEARKKADDLEAAKSALEVGKAELAKDVIQWIGKYNDARSAFNDKVDELNAAVQEKAEVEKAKTAIE
ncbi:uncharacterized protein AB675_3575 [Cyphellophora attinorum]|uniref:Uncharacterized protein n=1 Tax=Cyphellophora attinorum TaxID=1664694 RepID=A0A0N1P0X3_9EURO|nr:uncharacterized protein AB675_3575 [Phialophora attinorum]KPI39740.1 hypothetical protein AB675_3575 [Phialophora attinorum]